MAEIDSAATEAAAKAAETATTTQEGDDSGKGDLKVALHQERQEKKELQSKLEELQSKVDSLETGELSEDDRLRESFKQLTVKSVVSSVNQEKFDKLPSVVKSTLKTNPWAFVDEKVLKRETRFAETTADWWEIAGRVAQESIDAVLADYESGDQKTEDKGKGPDEEKANDTGDTALQYSEGELLVMRQKEPEKFAQLMRTLKQQRNK